MWGDRANDTAMMSLQILQNRAAKEILDLPFLPSASDALDRLGWKPLCHRRKEHRCSFIYKCINNLIYSDFNIVFNKDVCNYKREIKIILESHAQNGVEVNGRLLHVLQLIETVWINEFVRLTI